MRRHRGIWIRTGVLPPLLLVFVILWQVLPSHDSSSRYQQPPQSQAPADSSPQGTTALTGSHAQHVTLVRVVRVIDGDTIVVCCIEGRRERVRYIGIDTPETKHPTKGIEYFGKEAAAANRKLVEGKTVRLEFDVGLRDRYGRVLAYVYLEDGPFVNAWLVEYGYAQIITVPPNVKHQEMFLKLQREAREAGRGLVEVKFQAKVK